MMEDYKYYMRRYVDGAWEDDVDICKRFSGMKYLRCSGLSSKGSPKNVYSESYAETDELRMYFPDNAVLSNTDIEFEFVFSGENRRDVYDDFCEWIAGHRIVYWDTCRMREVEMYLSDAISPSDDYLYGSSPYMSAKFKFKNIFGKTSKREQT